MLKSFSGKIFLFILIFFPIFHYVQADDTAVEKLKSLLNKTQSLSANFSQITIEEDGTDGRQSEGVFLLQRPGKFRWSYLKPYQQTIVSNGEKIWFYDADLEQVTIKKVDAALGSAPALLLSGKVAMDENFTLEALGQIEGLGWIKLIPKSEESAFKYIMIGIDEKFMRAMELSDNFGQLTRINFSDANTDTEIDPSNFQLDPPPGVDIFEEE